MIFCFGGGWFISYFNIQLQGRGGGVDVYKHNVSVGKVSHRKPVKKGDSISVSQ